MPWSTVHVAVAALYVLSGAMVNEAEIADEPRRAIQTFCADEWPTDFRMQAYCQKRQSAAYWEWVDAATIVERVDKMAAPSPYEAAFATAYDGCVKDWWGPDNRPDFRMIVYCLTKQMAAYEQLMK